MIRKIRNAIRNFIRDAKKRAAEEGSATAYMELFKNIKKI